MLRQTHGVVRLFPAWLLFCLRTNSALSLGWVVDNMLKRGYQINFIIFPSYEVGPWDNREKRPKDFSFSLSFSSSQWPHSEELRGKEFSPTYISFGPSIAVLSFGFFFLLLAWK